MAIRAPDGANRVELVYMVFQMECPLEWVILRWFFQITLLQVGMNARLNKDKENYSFHAFMFNTDIFLLILTFVSYNYHCEGQNYNLSEFGRYISQSQATFRSWKSESF